MSESSFALNLSVVAIHGDASPGERVSSLKAGIADVVERVEQSIRVSFPNVRLQAQVISSSQACEGLDSSCVAAVLDVADLDAKLSFVSGSLHGAGISCIAVCQNDAQTVWRELRPQNTMLVTYRRLDDLWRAHSPLEEQLLIGIPQSRIHDELIYRFWFPRDTTSVWVVCPQIHDPGEYAHRLSPDYTYLDNLGDTDALLELTVFLSQYYPKATIEHFSADDLPDGHTRGNLVVIGGPGSAEISNEVCRAMMSAINSHVTYSDDCEGMKVTRDGATVSDLRAEYSTRTRAKASKTALARRHGVIAMLKAFFGKPSPLVKELATDWGYFARFQNPLNENATVVLVNGLHTAGVVGAARAFSERRETLRNYRSVYEGQVDVSRFESYFEVPLLNGEPKVPTVASANVLQLGRVVPGLPLAPQRPSTERRSTVRILFIAGDRGSSRVNQIQIPKEYHSIQRALRGSKHRDVVELTPPILGATRALLAEAYQERPTVLHCAGHGNDRCLAIIEDQGLVAGTIPFDVDQMCAMIQTMQERVRLCVLNACMSAVLAKEVVERDVVDFAIGWPGTVGDSAAIAFSVGLYGALGDGRTLQDSTDVGKVACGLTDEPMLFASSGKNTSIVLVDTGDTA